MAATHQSRGKVVGLKSEWMIGFTPGSRDCHQFGIPIGITLES
jgi:hypothetical protein